jgi:hypothetical protein
VPVALLLAAPDGHAMPQIVLSGEC